MHRDCAVSMNAVKTEDDSETPHIDVAMSIEDVATGQSLQAEPTHRSDGNGAHDHRARIQSLRSRGA
jgi:hypothetical protein